MRKGNIRWQHQSGIWSSWYDLNSPMPEYLKSSEIIAVELNETMTKAEYEELIKGANNVK